MKRETKVASKLATIGITAFNLAFVLWIMYNGIVNDFVITNFEKWCYNLLIVLLFANSLLLLQYRKHQLQ